MDKELKFRIIDGAETMDIEVVMALLANTYWANERGREQVELSMKNSRCYGVALEDGRQVGFARVISDFATTYYLCDVIIDPEYQNQGMGMALVSYIENLPIYQGLRGMLITSHAHGLYEKFGYETLNGRAMVKGLNC